MVDFPPEFNEAIELPIYDGAYAQSRRIGPLRESIIMDYFKGKPIFRYDIRIGNEQFHTERVLGIPEEKKSSESGGVPTNFIALFKKFRESVLPSVIDDLLELIHNERIKT